ncbi:ribonucleoprotein RB97D [Scaptodrosophila lebanonensis]|uniref:Ribonucleoprotein RB97D n=1 Tax=Drosophila lebanonensis TaxID=7225 RepID=A0A6J2T7Q6_DROLE|nr:ribonucleoprotein RB97D [Scaptodrosophila lebanonensis]
MVNNYVTNAPYYQESPQRKIVRSDALVTVVGASSNDNVTDANEHLRKIFVGGLPTHTSVETVRDFFNKFGEVADAVVMRDPVSNRSRGFGFVTFVDAATVDNVQRCRPHSIDNKTVETKRALPRHEANRSASNSGNIKSSKVFLGGLKDCHDENSLREHFSQFGKITNIKLLVDNETGRKRGFGFLDFEDMASADRALVQGKHTINLSAVEVKKAAQKPDPSKRVRMPVGGAARAGYAPPQPAIMENFSYNPTYNPYVAHSALPPSAFINGWASYVTPTVPPAPMYYPTPKAWNHYNKFGPQECTRNSYKTSEWTKSGYKHSHALANERPRNEYKSVQAQQQQQQQRSTAAKPEEVKAEGAAISPAVTAGGGDADRKWQTGDYKVFKPSGTYNAANAKQIGHVQSNRVNSLNQDIVAPAYGI